MIKAISLFSKFWFLLLALFIPIYLVRLHHQPVFSPPENVPVTVKGRISNQPYLKGSNQIFSVGPIFVKTERFPSFFYAQKVIFTGNLKKRVINDFKTQYWADYPEIKLMPSNQNSGILTSFPQFLQNFKKTLENQVNWRLNEPLSSLLNGILLGAKKEIPTNFWQKLQQTGTLHIVVASGYNLSVVASLLVSGLSFIMNRRKALFIAIIGIVCYTLMVGAEPPVVRAAIMAGIAFLAQIFGKEKQGIIGLILAAMVMLLVSPLILFDSGFQLSFTALAGIMILEPIFVKKGRIFHLPIIGQDLATTLAAQIGVMPIILTNFGQMSFLSPLINALVLPIVPLIMYLGIIMVLVGLIIPFLGQLFAWFASIPLIYFINIIDFSSRIPFASINIGKISGIWVLGYYLAILALVARSRYLSKNKSLRRERANEAANR